MGKTSQQFGERIKQHVPKHLMDSAKEPATKRRGRSPKKRDNPAGEYQSAIACHLAANKDCCVSYLESDFRVLSHRSKHHMDVLEAMYIYCLEHVSCKQKSYVTSLTLFMHSHSTPVMHSR